MIFEKLESVARALPGKKGIAYLTSTEKRVLDLAFTIPLAFPTAAITPFISLAIRHLEHQDPLYQQTRLSGHDNVITINKFQTLIKNAHLIEPDKPIHEIEDPRITPTGRWIRFCELDEIPQLRQVFRGELDLLGVRTLLEKDVDLVEASDEVLGPIWKDKYLNQLPRCGIITPHSLHDPDRKTAHGRNIPHDLDYMENASLGLDLFYYLFEVGPFIAQTLLKGFVKNINYLLRTNSENKASI